MRSRPSRGPAVFPAAALLLLLAAASGCISAKYDRVPKTTPLLGLNLRAADARLEARVQSVIVYQGPGAWKKEAYWDEYVLTFLNPGADPLVIDSLTIVDALNQKQSPGSEPWTLEESSRQNLKKFEHHGRRIFLGVGLSVAWGMAPAAALGGALGGSSALALAGLTAFFAIPAIVVTHVIVNKHARRDIQAEFERRRLPLPLALPPQGIMTGSVFFPISPGPQRLQIAAHRDSEPFTLVVDLLPLAGLHLFKAPEKPGSAPVPATNP